MAKGAIIATRTRELDEGVEVARRLVARRIREVTIFAITLTLGIAAGLSFSIIFLGSGVLVASLAIPIALLGTGAYYLLPPILAPRRGKEE